MAAARSGHEGDLAKKPVLLRRVNLGQSADNEIDTTTPSILDTYSSEMLSKIMSYNARKGTLVTEFDDMTDEVRSETAKNKSKSAAATNPPAGDYDSEEEDDDYLGTDEEDEDEDEDEDVEEGGEMSDAADSDKDEDEDVVSEPEDEPPLKKRRLQTRSRDRPPCNITSPPTGKKRLVKRATDASAADSDLDISEDELDAPGLKTLHNFASDDDDDNLSE